MADLGAVEIPLVVREQGLKESLRTVNRLEGEIRRAVAAANAQQISQDRLNKTLLNAKREYQQLGVSSQKATAAVRQFADAAREQQAAVSRSTTAMMGSTKGMNSMGVGMQQLGYQVGDFLVQVQSGTNALVAFGQQATQVVGFLPMMTNSFMGLSGTALVAFSAALGIIIPLVTAVGAAILRTSGESETLEDSINKLTDASSALAKGFSLVADENLEAKFGDLSDEARELTGIMLKLNAASELDALNDLIENLRGEADAGVFRQMLQGLRSVATLGMDIRGPAQVNEEYFQRLGLQMARSQFVAYTEELAALANQGDRAGVLEAFERFTEDATDAGAAVGEITAEGAALVQQLYNAMLAIAESNALLNGTSEEAKEAAAQTKEMADQADRFAALIEAGRQAQLDRNRAGMQAIRELENQLQIQEVIAQHGEDSVEVVRERARQEAIAKNLSTENATAYQDLVVRIHESEQAIRDAAEQAERLRDAIRDSDAASSGLTQRVDTLRARLAEARGEQGAVLANTLAQMRAEAELRHERRIAAGESEENSRVQLILDRRRINQIGTLTQAIEDETEANKDRAGSVGKVREETEKLSNELDGPLTSAIGGVSNAWADFVMRGFEDFSSFKDAIINSFKNMIAQMIAIAARNRIMLSLGVGGGAAGAVGTAANAGGLLGSLGNMSQIGMLAGTGLGSAVSGLATGFMSTINAGFAGMSGAISGGLSIGGISGISTAIGAAIPVLGAVAAAVSFFRSKTKLLDSGLQATVKNMDALIETFEVVEKSRFWGLSKKVRTNLSEVSEEEAEPLIKAIQDIQQSVIDAAGAFGIAGSTFDNFVYKFRVSLKGLSEEEKMQKINEELVKMGDAFASLTGHFETMNELLEAANQRMELQNRLDQLLGNNQAILNRQREAELAAMHEVNRPLAQAIYQLEDAQAAVGQAFASLRASIDAEKNRLRDSFASIVEGLRERLEVANDTLSRSRNIYQMLESALSGRFVSSGISSMFSRREGALNFLRGGNFEDEKTLREALTIVGEPTEDLFSSFVEYARDFYYTSAVIEEAKKIAEVQLTADEKQVLLLEQQIADAEANLDKQLAALDEQLAAMERQYNALLGIDDSVKSVEEAIGTLKEAIEALADAQKKAEDIAGMGAGAAGAGVQKANEAGQGLIQKLGQSGIATRESDNAKFQQIDIRGAQQLLDAAALVGVSTRGKTGAQIQQEISNAGYIGVNMDNATRAQQFAMGGFHTGGLRIVGERGPELEATGASRIFSHNQTAGMFRDPELKDAVRSLKEEVAGLRSEQRQIQMNIAKYTKRNYDLERKWDVDGLPATRT